MQQKKLGLAFRPELHTPSQIVEYCEIVDNADSITHIFVPDIPGGLEAIEISTAALSITKKVKIGSGIIRLHEHESKILGRRLETIQALSQNRLILGVGTGRALPTPSEAISKMLSQLDELRSNFGNATKAPGLKMPETFVASLKKGIARKALGHCDGLLLNFCSPEYAKNLVDDLSQNNEKMKNNISFACYLKVFYAKEEIVANRLLIEEFAKYDSITHYHEMFARDGIAEEIAEAKRTLESSRPIVPSSLSKISLVNPNSKELEEYVELFRGAGIDIPVIYPYFVRGEDHEYKKSVILDMVEFA